MGRKIKLNDFVLNNGIEESGSQAESREFKGRKFQSLQDPGMEQQLCNKFTEFSEENWKG